MTENDHNATYMHKVGLTNFHKESVHYSNACDISNLHLSANRQSVVLVWTCESACLLNQAGNHMGLMVQRDVNRRLMHYEAGKS